MRVIDLILLNDPFIFHFLNIFDLVICNQNVITCEMADFSVVMYAGFLQSFSLLKLHPFLTVNRKLQQSNQ